MQFGKTDQIEQIDFTLPPDDALTDKMFAGLKTDASAPVELYVGSTRWGNKNWVGKLYPKGTKEKDFLAQYVRQFNCIELNTLFYSLQSKEIIARWASLTDGHFRFCPKFSNSITHLQQLKNAEEDTDLFIDHVRSFGASLGPCFLQLSEGFAPSRAGILQDYARQLPRDLSTCIELRQEDWFAPAVSTGGTAGAMHVWETFLDLGIGTVITDTSGRRDVLHMKLTAPVAFIRFVGNNLHPTDFPRIDAWADRIKTWIGKGLREIYFFVHTSDEENTPELAKYAVEQFNKKCGLNLKPPQILRGGGAATELSLF